MALPTLLYLAASFFYLEITELPVLGVLFALFCLASLVIRPRGTTLVLALAGTVVTAVLFLAAIKLLGTPWVELGSRIPVGVGLGMLVSTALVAFSGLNTFDVWAMLSASRLPANARAGVLSAYRSFEITVPSVRRVVLALRLRGMTKPRGRALTLLLANLFLGYLEFLVNYLVQWEICPPERGAVPKGSAFSPKSALLAGYLITVIAGAIYG